MALALAVVACADDDGDDPGAGDTSVTAVTPSDTDDTEIDAAGGEPVGTAPGPEWVGGIDEAVAAVEAELGEGQAYFEVTATPRFTNVFVAVEDGSAVVPYLYADGRLDAPGPRADVEQGFTFTADAIAFDPDAVLVRVTEELADSTIESLSVEGGQDGTVRYVVRVRSDAGGSLDVVVGPDGAVLSVIPL